MKPQPTDSLRITDQYRSSRNAMSYDLRSPDGRLNLRVASRESAADQDDWRIDATTDAAVVHTTVTAWGSTRTEALGRVAASWRLTNASALPCLDWSAVAAVLTAVRAL